MILTKILDQSVKKFGNKPALSMKIGFRNNTLSYKEVYQLSKKIAILLEQHGIGKGDKVLICAPNSPNWICVFWATLLRGAIIVPLNVQTTKSVIAKIAEQTEAKIIFKHIFFKHELNNNIKQFTIEFLQEIISDIDLNEFRQEEIQQGDLYQIMYTSGTTGDPKGVMLSHENVYSNLDAVSKVILVDLEKDRLLSILPLSHIFEQTAGFLLPFSRGVHIIYAHSYGAFRQLLKKYKITKILAVPEFLQILMSRIQSEAALKNQSKLLERLFWISEKLNCKFISRLLFYPIIKNLGGKLDTIASGGAALNAELEKKWELMGVEILEGYGLTETSPIVSMNTFESKRLGSVGKVISNVEVKLAPDSEILVKGPNVFVGYFKNEQKTKEVFTNDGWFKTGDLGYFDKDGFLYIKGRKKYVIIGPGGQNVYPEDIEIEVNKIPGVVDSCVLGIEQLNGNVEIHAVILLPTEKQVAPEEVVKKANEHLSSYQKITNYTVWHDVDFPRTVTRKVKKEEVRKFIENQRQTEEVKISEQKKSRIIQILSQITGKDIATISDSTKIVSELNLDSLMRIELVSWIEEDMGAIIEETDITPSTTVSDLENLIKSKKSISEKSQLKNWPRSNWILPIRFILQQMVFAIFRPFMKFKIEGQENLKNIKYPVIFMPNHKSYLDSIVMSMALGWPIRKKLSFAAARDFLYEYNKIIVALIDAGFNSFPIQRKGQENIKLGLDFIGQMLDQKHSVVLFPEGRMSETGEMLPLKKGAGLIAVEMQVPIIPIKIIGTENVVPYGKLFPIKRDQVIVRIGKPLMFKQSDSHSIASEKIEQALKDL